MEPKARKKGCLFYGLVAVAVFMGLVVIGNMLGGDTDPLMTNEPSSQTGPQENTQVQPEPVPEPSPDLEILSYRNEREHGFIKVMGEVRNVSGSKIDNLMVTVTYYTSDGQMVRSDDALIEYNPIMNNQTSPFQTIGTDNPAIARYVLSFKVMFGGTVSYKDLTK